MAEHPKHADGLRTPSEFDRELDFRVLIIFMVALVVITIAAFIGMWAMGIGLRGQLVTSDPPAYPLTESADALLPPLPRLQVEPYGDWELLRERMASQLSTYAWTDRDAGKVRIPIDEAMRRVTENGLPVFPPLPPLGPGGGE